MINTDNKHFFFIEPDKEARPSRELVDDYLTEAVAFILEQSYAVSNQFWWRGVHETRCGVRSGNAPIFTPMNRHTNTLAEYYVAAYREHIPKSEILKIIEELGCIAGIEAKLDLDDGGAMEMEVKKNQYFWTEEMAGKATYLLMEVAKDLID